jgi:hypothetical protein
MSRTQQVEPGLVVEVRTETVGLRGVRELEEAACEAVSLLMGGVGEIPRGERWGREWGGPCDEEQITERRGPQVSEYTVYIRDDLMRMDLGGSSLVARLSSDASTTTWVVLDEASGRIVNTTAFDEGISRFGPAGQNMGEVVRTPPVVTRTSRTDSILGRSVTQYDYEYGMNLEPFGSGQPRVEATVKGHAWIATDSPVAQSDYEAALLSILSAGVMGKDLGLGLPLRTSESQVVKILSSTHGAVVMEGSSSSEVTAISRQSLDDALFGVDQPVVKQCDCSCEAYKRLMAIGEMSEEQQAAQPDAMPLAMCAPKCGFQWATACKTR